MVRWVRQFNDRRTNVHYEACSRRPSVVKYGLVEKVNEKIRENIYRRFTKLLGAVDTRRYPRVGKRVWSDQEDHEERGSKDRAASTCGPHSDSFNDTSRRRRSNCFTNNFLTPFRSKSLIQAPFPCTSFNTETSATASTVVPSQINVECHRLAKGAIFEQDNARPYTGRVAQDFLRHFQTLPWPAHSPDLSPVEHVWDQLKRQIPSCQLCT
ncbi:uncharacterized protein TNCV_1576921 [Trichonephila clavipes]|nr:uncharacterized protein TNCV_1576921 [Trichonephila clavipes]